MHFSLPVLAEGYFTTTNGASRYVNVVLGLVEIVLYGVKDRWCTGDMNNTRQEHNNSSFQALDLILAPVIQVNLEVCGKQHNQTFKWKFHRR